MLADKDIFSRVPTCHITESCKVNKFHKHTDFVKGFGKGESPTTNKTKRQPNLVLLNHRHWQNLGKTDSKTFAFIQKVTENKILKPLCSERKWLRTPLPQAQSAPGQRLLLKNNLNYSTCIHSVRHGYVRLSVSPDEICDHGFLRTHLHF